MTNCTSIPPGNSFSRAFTTRFPDPYLERDKRFSQRWQKLHRQQLIREDLRDLTQIQYVDQFEVFTRLLEERSGEQVIFSKLAADVRVSVETVRQLL